jgi:curved DNA-binding protein CbpA
MLPEYYKLLGILPTATTYEIKKAYRQLALKYHPDRNNGDEYSENIFRKITEAYEILSDPEKREKYNWELNLFKQNSNSQNVNENRSSKNNTTNISSTDILKIVKDIKRQLIAVKPIFGIDKSKVNQSILYRSLIELLSNSNISILVSLGENSLNKNIINEVLDCCKYLEYHLAEKIFPKLAKLAGSDNETIRKIYALNKQQKYLNYWRKYRGASLVIGFIVFIFFSISDSNYTSYSTSKDNQMPNGELNDTTVIDPNELQSKEYNTINGKKESNVEEIFLQERNKLINEGWIEAKIKNGQFPSCYNFISQKSKIDNFIEVQVGGGTDVAIKVMNFETDICIRYVFINSSSTYKIRNLPEGKYYLKIAYGKKWFFKNENGQCIGKFLQMPIYKKGEEIMDFTIKYLENTYSIPSFRLSLDVASSNNLNTFDSKKITEGDFNL